VTVIMMVRIVRICVGQLLSSQTLIIYVI